MKSTQLALAFITLLSFFSSSLFADSTKVSMKTSLGDIEITLNDEKAPISVANFLAYVDDGFYDSTIFHRVINSFMIQGGGFTKDMAKKQTKKPIANEANNGLKNKRGTLAMARTSSPHSATAQFFINHANNRNLDYPSMDGWGYAVFGKVTKGMDIVDKIADVFTTKKGRMSNVPEKTIMILSITRL